MRPTLATLMLAMLALGPSVAAGDQATQSPFNAAKSFDCRFTVYAAVVWNAGQPSIISNPQDFAFQIDSLDRRRNRARIVGSGGSSPATLMPAETGLNVIEPTLLGNLNLTTIFLEGGQGTRYLAVHSRHLGDVSGPPRVSQTYGTCEAKP